MPEIDVSEEPWARVGEHARIPIAYEVRSVMEVRGRGPGGSFRLAARAVATPWTKDYDALEHARPDRLARKLDVANWGLLVARREGRRVGGAILARDTPGVSPLEGRRDLALLWDLRVAPEERRRGVGTALWRAAEAWAIARGCRVLQVETQDVNVPACRFYARQGCALRAVNRGAYAEHPEEVQLLWAKDLARRSKASRGDA